MARILIGDAEVSDDMDIFFLEDSPVYQKRLVTCVRSIGLKGKVTMAGTVAEAMKLITVARPGLIFSDWNLPDGIGLDFLKLVRGEKKFDQVPLIMVTTMDDISKITAAMKHGADDYVVKPFYETEMVEKLSFAFEKRQPKHTGLPGIYIPRVG